MGVERFRPLCTVPAAPATNIGARRRREQRVFCSLCTRPDASREISAHILLSPWRERERERESRGKPTREASRGKPTREASTSVLVPRRYGLNILLPVFSSYSLPHQIGTEAYRLRKPPLSKSRGHHVVCPPPPVQNQIELQTRETTKPCEHWHTRAIRQ
jgi:hypothetical protein